MLRKLGISIVLLGAAVLLLRMTYAHFGRKTAQPAAATSNPNAATATADSSGAASAAPSAPSASAALMPAPELTLTDLNGAVVRTSDYKGKVVLVNFWAAWCTPCADEVPQFVALENKYQEQGLRIIGFSVEDDAGELRDFYRKYRMNYPVVPSTLRIADSFGGVLGLPTTLVIGRDGKIHTRHNGSTNFSTLEQEVVALLRAP